MRGRARREAGRSRRSPRAPRCRSGAGLPPLVLAPRRSRREAQARAPAKRLLGRRLLSSGLLGGGFGLRLGRSRSLGRGFGFLRRRRALSFLALDPLLAGLGLVRVGTG